MIISSCQHSGRTYTGGDYHSFSLSHEKRKANQQPEQPMFFDRRNLPRKTEPTKIKRRKSESQKSTLYKNSDRELKREGLKKITKAVMEKYEESKRQEPIHSRRSDRFKVVSNYAAFQKIKQKEEQSFRTRDNFMRIKKQAICSFNQYSLNFINRIKRQTGHNFYKYPKTINIKLTPPNKNKIKFKPNNTQYPESAPQPQKYQFCRPWSRNDEEDDFDTLK